MSVAPRIDAKVFCTYAKRCFLRPAWPAQFIVEYRSTYFTDPTKIAVSQSKPLFRGSYSVRSVGFASVPYPPRCLRASNKAPTSENNIDHRVLESGDSFHTLANDKLLSHTSARTLAAGA